MFCDMIDSQTTKVSEIQSAIVDMLWLIRKVKQSKSESKNYYSHQTTVKSISSSTNLKHKDNLTSLAGTCQNLIHSEEWNSLRHAPINSWEFFSLINFHLSTEQPSKMHAASTIASTVGAPSSSAFNKRSGFYVLKHSAFNPLPPLILSINKQS